MCDRSPTFFPGAPTVKGLVDIDTGKVQRGVELVPLKDKIFSGWYDKVAVRKLKGLSDKQRRELYQKLLEVWCLCFGRWR